MWDLGLMLLETSLVGDFLDIEGAIHMSASDKIQWVNTGTYISGTDSAMTIDSDDTLSVNADTSMTFTSPTNFVYGAFRCRVWFRCYREYDLFWIS